jgi:hypothetical protein
MGRKVLPTYTADLKKYSQTINLLENYPIPPHVSNYLKYFLKGKYYADG